MADLREEIDNYVKDMLKNCEQNRVRAPKVIHDTILGSNLFKPYEIAILDLPIVQRLRRINQVDVVSLVFPSGNHNRFEHTLGVAVIAEKLVSALYRKIEDGVIRFNQLNQINKEYTLRHVRMAAIMHDCGHGPFSHMSEQVYKYFDDIKDLKKKEAMFNGASEHEILSYLIVTSKYFKDYFENHIKEQYNVGEVDLDLVGQMIIGYVQDPDKAFLLDIINGAFDADKLDYIQRDSHFTGIKMVLDLHRLFHTLNIVDVDGKLRLSVDLGGVSTLEQIVFNKMMLYSTVYQHHKVLAAECIFKSLFDDGNVASLKYLLGRDFSSSAHFLYYTDDDVFSIKNDNNDDECSALAEKLFYRNLPKRAFVISGKTIEQNIESKDGLRTIMSFYKTPEGVNSLREVISEKTDELGQPVSMQDIWVDIPIEPNFNEGMLWPIKSYGEGYKKLREIFPVDDWVRAFSENKWQGYVFTWPKYRETVYQACLQVFAELHNIQFNDLSRQLCKFGDLVN